jgi:nicotinate-nucleotide pyrophosphorylase (carboxylating)
MKLSREPAILFALKEALEPGFKEDLGSGDITGSAVLPEGIQTGEFTAKAAGVLAGTDVIDTGYAMLDSSIETERIKKDGQPVQPGDLIAKVKGPAESLLAGERVILNLLQHLSGIATATNQAVEAMQGSATRICDTRKTLPGLRTLQKYAVRCGGGYNHRMRLDDGIMIKDNHIKAAGGIRQVVGHAKEMAGLMVKIEVECETEEQVREAVEAGADIIMLDNRSPEEAGRLRSIIPDHILVELSGGITVQNAGHYRDCGADYISLGSLTHSVMALDISFNLVLSIE